MPEITRPVPFDTPEADRILEALQVFPPDNPWNRDVSAWPVHPDSRKIIASIGPDKPMRYNPDMGFILVPPDQGRVPVKITEYASESDRGPFPVPGSDADRGLARPLQEGPQAPRPEPGRRPAGREGPGRRPACDRRRSRQPDALRVLRGEEDRRRWEAKQASVFDLKTNRLRPEGWTSSDAAGLPVFPAIVRHDELSRGVIGHALRVTVRRTRRAYVHPATHFASRSDDPDLPRMGERIRLRRDFETAGFSPPVRTILEALKRHGMLVADNGLDWAISVAPDERIPVLHQELRRVKGADFEVVQEPG